MKKVRITITISEETRDELINIAHDQRRSLSNTVEMALDAYVDSKVISKRFLNDITQ